ncbi:MAG: type VI secretion system tube protein Hcp [Polyangiales bacterium]
MDVYLKFEPDLPGEVDTQGFEKQIRVFGFSLAMQNHTSMVPGKNTQKGEVTLESMTFSKVHDSSSAELMKRCANGLSGAASKCTISVVATEGTASKAFCTIKLSDVLVASFSVSGSAGAGPAETYDNFKLYYSKIEYEYTHKGNKNDVVAKPKFNYDLAKKMLT